MLANAVHFQANVELAQHMVSFDVWPLSRFIVSELRSFRPM